MDRNNLVIPSFRKPTTRKEAFNMAEQLTGKVWNEFSSARKTPKATWDLLRGHAFLGKRIKGPEWHISQPLCWLCGQDQLTSKELIIALGRNPIVGPDGKLEEQVNGAVRSNPSQELVEKIQSYALEIYPVAKYEKRERFYDKGLPQDSLIPYIYVIEDIKGDVKIGISTKHKTRFRTIESYEDTVIKQYSCSKPTPRAYLIEQTLLSKYGRGKHPTKKSQEWLWKIPFEEVKAYVDSIIDQSGVYDSPNL